MAVKKEYTFTYKDLSDRKRKNLAILDCIRRRGDISRTEISKETGINIVSISNYVTSYVKKHLVLEGGLDISTGGRRPELVRLNLESAYVTGLDIGSEKLVAVVADLGLKAKARVVMPRPEGNMDRVMAGAISALEQLFKELGRPLADIKLIGIGVSGIVDIHSGTIHDTNPARDMTKTNLFNLVRLLEKKFNIPSLIGNDATCAVFGELSINHNTEISEMLYMYADIGCGIIINRDIYCGTSGSAGEIQLLSDNKAKKAPGITDIAGYGVKGVDLGIVEKAKKLIEKGDSTNILKLAGDNKNMITKEIIFEAAEKGDKLARELLIDAAHWLGIKVAYLINIFNPQLVIIGGGIEKAGSIFMDRLSSYVKNYAFEEAFNAIKILPSFLGEDAIALGAASLGMRELFINA